MYIHHKSKLKFHAVNLQEFIFKEIIKINFKPWKVLEKRNKGPCF